MFSFKANIVKRRRISKRSLLTGLISAALLGYMGLTYLDLGLVPLIEKFIDQIGVAQYSSWIYLSILALLVMAILPAIRTLFKKKTVFNGAVSFDEKHLKIVKGKEKFLIPQEELKEINFDLKKAIKKKSKKAIPGGNFMRIPTQKGIFECELELDSDEQKLDLMNMVEYLKIQHDVKVKVREK